MNEIKLPPAADIFSAVEVLWNSAEDRLDDETLKWLARADTEELPLRNLADTVEAIGCAISADEGRTFEDNGKVSALLFTLSEALQTRAAMAWVKGAAQDLLQNPDFRAKLRDAGRQEDAERKNASGPDAKRKHA